MAEEKQMELEIKTEEKSKKGLRIWMILVLILVAAVFYYLYSQYGIFYTKGKREELTWDLVAQAGNFLAEAKFPEAEITARKALRHNDKNSDAYLLLGQSLYAQSKWEEASAVYVEGLENDPDNLEMNFYAANVFRDLAKFDLSEKYYRQALAVDPSNQLIWVNFAMSYSWDQKNPQGALKIYEEAVSKNPDDEFLKEKYESLKKDLENSNS